MKNMRGEDPDRPFVEPWKPIPFLLAVGAVLLILAGIVWLVTNEIL